MARRYTDGLLEQLESLDVQQGHPSGKLAAYVSVFCSTLEQRGRMCLCGMLAAEIDGVPPAVRAEVRRFVDLNVRWLSGIIARATGKSATSAAVRDQATAMFAALEGAMLVARGAGDIARFDAVAAHFERSGLLQL